MPFSVLFIDLDDLKQINDSFGHNVGSALIAEVGGLLQQCFRKSDVLGRIGGDEFVVAGEASEMSIYLAVQRLEQATREWNAQPGRQGMLSFSYGHVTSNADSQESLDELLSKADTAMYRTKRRKKLMRDSDPSQRIAL